jgi:FlaA1/EpsC-like NDP-sugar epimerase
LELCANQIRLLKEVDALRRRGTIRPASCIKSFKIAELDQALLYFSKGTHIGKIVVRFDTERSVVPMLHTPSRARFDSYAIYVIVGGLGGLGRSIVQWMVDHGARNLAVFNRSGTSPAEALRLVDDLTQQGVSIRILKCDVADKSSVSKAMCVVAKNGQIKGILHAAVVLEDRLFSNLSYSEWKHGLDANSNSIAIL